MSHGLFSATESWKTMKECLNQIWVVCYLKLKENIALLLPTSNLTIIKLFLGLEKVNLPLLSKEVSYSPYIAYGEKHER